MVKPGDGRRFRLGLIASLLPVAVPVDPDAPEARDWLIEELSKPEYQAAKPTLLDIIGQAIMDWLTSLLDTEVGAPPQFSFAIVLALAALAIVLAFVIFGVPRLGRRSRVIGTLFGEDDARTAEQMRRAGDAAAGRGEYGEAIAEYFRAIARGMAERTIVSTAPGTTAQGFADRAAAPFPAHAERLGLAADAFDEVRYLDHPGTAERLEQVRALERELRAARPALEEVAG